MSSNNDLAVSGSTSPVQGSREAVVRFYMEVFRSKIRTHAPRTLARPHTRTPACAREIINTHARITKACTLARSHARARAHAHTHTRTHSQVPLSEYEYKEKAKEYEAAIAKVAYGVPPLESGLTVRTVAVQSISMPPWNWKRRSFSSSSLSSPSSSLPAAAAAAAAFDMLSSSAAAVATSASSSLASSSSDAPPSNRRLICNTALPEGSMMVQVTIEVETTVAKIDYTWDRLNEHALNEAMSQRCLAPVVVTFDNIDESKSQWWVVIIVISVACCLPCFLCFCCCRSKSEEDVSANIDAQYMELDPEKDKGGEDNPWEQVAWADMLPWQRVCWVELGWTQRKWDLESDPNPATDEMEFTTLQPRQKMAARMLGYTKSMWDGGRHPFTTPTDPDKDFSEWVLAMGPSWKEASGKKFGADPNPWDDFSWVQLPEKYQALWTKLGWHQMAWDQGVDNPNTEFKTFASLPEAKQDAAMALGYTAEIWDAGCHPLTLPDADFEAMRRADAASKAEVPPPPAALTDVSLESKADVEVAMLFCAQCGTKRTTTGKFCANCGAAGAANAATV